MRADMMVCGYAGGGSPSLPGRGLGALGASAFIPAAEELGKGNYLNAAANTAYGMQGVTTMAPKIASKLLPTSALRAIPGIGNIFGCYN